MIRNDQELQATLDRITQFQKVLENLRQADEPHELSPQLRRLPS